jgi:hypothetical protein
MKTRITFTIALLATLTANAWAADKNMPPLDDLPLPERWLPLDEDGWTNVKPAADSQLIYVSSSEGNDETAQVYRPGDKAVGSDSFRPAGTIRPFKTIVKAMEQARDKQPGALRWKNMRITNNVMLDIGKSRPTGRTLGWYVDATDWDGGLIANNLFLHQRNPDVRNVYAICVGSSDAKGTYQGTGVHCRNVTIRDNVIHGLESSGPMVRIGGGPLFENVVFSNNKVQLPGLQQQLTQVGDLAGVKFEGNRYFSDGEAGTLFAIGTRADREELGFNDWVAKSGETEARFEKTPFPDPDRSIERYMQSLGSAPTHAAFIAGVRKQSKANWRPELTAPVINDWIRAGFGTKKAREWEDRRGHRPLRHDRTSRHARMPLIHSRVRS